ncbi:MAG: alanyl-tRNA editing protein [Candidatus Zhuqueibacterota bacterium]
MTTEKLFLNDSYRCEFDARVVRAFTLENKTAIVLDRTAFYPTSGGQKHDTGRLNHSRVIDVIEQDEEIVHILESPVTAAEVHGVIDWPRRFDFMQQHTGFHILAGSFLQITGAATVSSHLGNEISTIDISLDAIEREQIIAVENLANRIIFENRPVNAYSAEPGRIDAAKIRKALPALPLVRLVDIDNFDLDPCGGTHVRASGEVGLVKIIRWEKIRGDLRFHFFAGSRAIKDYQQKWQICSALAAKFSVDEDDVVPAVEKMQSEMGLLQKQNKKMTQQLLVHEAGELVRNAEQSGSKVIALLFEDRPLNDIRELARQITATSDIWALLGLKAAKAHLIFAHSGASAYNLNELVRQVAHLIDGRGGGRPNFVEIGGDKTSALEETLHSARVILENGVLKS